MKQNKNVVRLRQLLVADICRELLLLHPHHQEQEMLKPIVLLKIQLLASSKYNQ